MDTNETATTEIVEAPKDNFIKKALRNPKQLAIGAGITLAAIAGVVWFAVKRSDEEDFNDEFSEEDETSADPAVV
jgi:hypothetical protein